MKRNVEPGFCTDVLVGYTMRGDEPLPVRVTFDDGRIWRVHVGSAFVGLCSAEHAYSVALAWVQGRALAVEQQAVQEPRP